MPARHHLVFEFVGQLGGPERDLLREALGMRFRKWGDEKFESPGAARGPEGLGIALDRTERRDIWRVDVFNDETESVSNSAVDELRLTLIEVIEKISTTWMELEPKLYFEGEIHIRDEA